MSVSSSPPIRKIIHIDMDAFFASVEQRDHPEWIGKPLVVGGEGKRSVVAAASYEAREFGIYSAMPMAIARLRCKNLIIAPHRFSEYKRISNHIRNIFLEYTDLVEPLSLDEAFLDVSNNFQQKTSAMAIARDIKQRINADTKLTCTAGVSVNKFLAKIASGMNKPDGLTVIMPDDVARFVRDLPIEKFYGIGKVTAEKMKALGIQIGGDLQKHSKEQLVEHFGKAGRYFYDACRGVDGRPVNPSRIRKSISIERTFEEDLQSREEISKVLQNLVTSLINSLVRMDVKGRTVIVKWRYPNFRTVTRSRSFNQFTRSNDIIEETVLELFMANTEKDVAVRLLGVGLSNLDTEGEPNQLQLSFDS
ncbi:MAG: DNA polymerase IV [Saprospiraceae bacterium]|nr:DNA polymerase IV [Saprospiraceae bacterium]